MSDFSEMCDYNQTSPDSHFTQQTICSIATVKGRVSLSDDDLIITKGRKIGRLPVNSPEAKEQILRDYFGIEWKGGSQNSS